MTNAVTPTGICLHGLPAREEAVVKRVISFSGTQGRNYTLSAMDAADILVISDETAVDFAEMNPAGCMIIRIADPATTQAYDVLMQRPLLVTKVMRTLDEANALLKASQPEVPAAEPVPVSAEPTVATPGSDEQPHRQPSVVTAVSTDGEPATPIVPAEETQAGADSAETAIEPAAKANEQTAEETPALAAQTQKTGVPQQQKPATSLYAQIMMGKAKAATAANGLAAVTQTTQAAEKGEVQQTESTAEESIASQVSGQQGDEAEQNVSEEASGNHDSEQDEHEQVPQEDNTDLPTAKHASATEKPAADQSKYHHIALVVDDSLAIRKQLELELRDAGIGAEFAETGEEALEKVATNSYDLVFLDIIMPGIDGYEACRQMRIRPDMKKTPIIMLSAKTSPLDEVQGVIAGASTYLTKPVKSEQLQKTLKRVSMWLDNFQITA